MCAASRPASVGSTPERRVSFVSAWASSHVRDQKFGFGLVEARPLFPALHEVSGLLQVPGALRFVKDDHMLMRRAGLDQSIVAEMVHVLDKRLYAFADLAFPHLLALVAPALELIPGECFPQHRNQRSVSRKENRMNSSAKTMASIITTASMRRPMRGMLNSRKTLPVIPPSDCCRIMSSQTQASR
jgi:hypothetical protein